MPSGSLKCSPGWNVLEILAEPLHDSDRVARHGVIGRPCAQGNQREQGQDDHAAPAATRQHLPELLLPLPDQVPEIGGCAPAAPATPGATLTAVTVL